MSFIKREIILNDWIEYSICTTCWNKKELNEKNFRKNSSWRWYKWYRSQCRDCERKRWREYIKLYNEINPDYKKEYYLEHKEQKKIYNKVYQHRNKEHIKIIKKNRIERNRDKIYEQNKMRQNTEMYKNMQKERRWLYNVDINKRKIQIKTSGYIKRNNLRPSNCPICNSKRRVISHHIDYTKRNIVVWCCDRCHRLIHSWYLKCPEPIDLLNNTTIDPSTFVIRR